jgi:hypothetical protein
MRPHGPGLFDADGAGRALNEVSKRLLGSYGSLSVVTLKASTSAPTCSRGRILRAPRYFDHTCAGHFAVRRDELDLDCLGRACRRNSLFQPIRLMRALFMPVLGFPAARFATRLRASGLQRVRSAHDHNGAFCFRLASPPLVKQHDQGRLDIVDT